MKLGGTRLGDGPDKPFFFTKIPRYQYLIGLEMLLCPVNRGWLWIDQIRVVRELLFDLFSELFSFGLQCGDVGFQLALNDRQLLLRRRPHQAGQNIFK